MIELAGLLAHVLLAIGFDKKVTAATIQQNASSDFTLTLGTIQAFIIAITTIASKRCSGGEGRLQWLCFLRRILANHEGTATSARHASG
jgi:hypothetical protein